MADADRLRQIFADPALRWLVERLEDRLRRGRPLAGRVARRRPSAQERRALDALLGRSPSRARSLSLDLGELEERLRRAGLAASLHDAAECLVGDTIARRRRAAARRGALRRRLEQAAEHDARPAVVDWLRSRRTWVLLRRWGRDEAQAERLLDDALGVLARLPASGQLLQELAVAATGDAHALDPGRRLGTLVIDAVARLGSALEPDARAAVPDWHDAAGWRDAWTAVGVLVDELSAPVLALGLPGDPSNPLGAVLELHRRDGDPCRISLRQLRRHGEALRDHLDRTGIEQVFVCENPAVVAAAADRLQALAAPLLCLEGQPATAARRLLDLLAQAGVRLRYHGDFDWAGLRIANLVMARHGAAPWRYTADDYLRAVVQQPPGAPRLRGEPVAATWDPRLEPAMSAYGRAVEEEAVLGDLLGDLLASAEGSHGGT